VKNESFWWHIGMSCKMLIVASIAYILWIPISAWLLVKWVRSLFR
jgi:hypothetical protein